MPSIDTLEISKGKVIQSIPSYFGCEEEEEIPDMADFENSENLVETDPVGGLCFYFQLYMLNT